MAGAGHGACPPRPGDGTPVRGPGDPQSGREGRSEQSWGSRGRGTCHSPPPRPTPTSARGAHLGHPAGLWRLGALEGGHLLAGELQVALARGLEPAIAHAAVVEAPALPVLSLGLPVTADPEPLGRAPAGAHRAVAVGASTTPTAGRGGHTGGGHGRGGQGRGCRRGRGRCVHGGRGTGHMCVPCKGQTGSPSGSWVGTR